MATAYIIAGLGNPGEEYENTRHNAGRIVLERIFKIAECPEWKKDLKAKALVTKGELGGRGVLLVEPETFMNNSGQSLKVLVPDAKKAAKLIVVHDDVDLPLGALKISYGRGSGGHRGIESIIKHLKTMDFIRVRVGVAPTTPGGKLKKPSGDRIGDFVVGEFKKAELDVFKKAAKKAAEVIECIVAEGKDAAMNAYN
jgi:peptidyl-tRNA hydrolase, PTH1 family